MPDFDEAAFVALLARLAPMWPTMTVRGRAEERLFPVSVGDWSPRPLTEKILERPRLVERLRSLVPATDHAVVLPFVTTELEAGYGPRPTSSTHSSRSSTGDNPMKRS